MENTREQSFLRWLVLGFSVVAVYKLWRVGRKMFWIALGFGWVAYWTGGWRFF